MDLNNNGINDFVELFAPMRGGAVIASDVSQIVAGASSAGLLGFMSYTKIQEMGASPTFAAILAILLAVLFFLVVEWIQSKSWATFFDETFKNRIWKGGFSYITVYRIILNIVILAVSVMCASISMSTSYYASEDTGDAMVADVVQVDLGAVAKASIDAQNNYNTSTDSKIADLQNQIKSIESGIGAKREEAKQGLGSKMIALSQKSSDQWAKVQIRNAQNKVERQERGRIAAIQKQIESIESDKNRTIREMSASNTHAIQISSAQYNKNQKKVESKEKRNTLILAFFTVGASLIFISFQLVMGLDRGITGMSYQEQRQYAPKSFQMVSKWFDPQYETRSGIKPKEFKVQQTSRRGRPRKKKEDKGYQPKTPFGKLLNAVGVKAESELEENNPVYDQTGQTWTAKKAEKKKTKVFEVYSELYEAKGGEPTVKEIENATGFPNSSVRRYLSELKEEGSI